MTSNSIKGFCPNAPLKLNLHFLIFRDLLDHYDDIVNSVARRSILEDCYAEIVELMGEENAPPPDYFLEVYGRTVINSFNILDPIEQVSRIEYLFCYACASSILYTTFSSTYLNKYLKAPFVCVCTSFLEYVHKVCMKETCLMPFLARKSMMPH